MATLTWPSLATMAPQTRKSLATQRQTIEDRRRRLRCNLTALRQRNSTLVRLTKLFGALRTADESLRDHYRECPCRRALARGLALRNGGDVGVAELNAASTESCRRCRSLTDRIVRLHATPTPANDIDGHAHAGEECIVCLEPLTSRDERWQCAVCKVKLHAGCFAGCVRANLGQAAVDCAACPHCRSSGSAARFPPLQQ